RERRLPDAAHPVVDEHVPPRHPPIVTGDTSACCRRDAILSSDLSNAPISDARLVKICCADMGESSPNANAARRFSLDTIGNATQKLLPVGSYRRVRNAFKQNHA